MSMWSGQQWDISNCQGWKYPSDMVCSCSKMTLEDCEACSRCYSTEPSGFFHLKWIKGCLSAASPELVLIELAVTERPSKQLCVWKGIKTTVCTSGWWPWYKDDIAMFAFWTLWCIVMLHTQRSNMSFALCGDVLSQFCIRHRQGHNVAQSAFWDFPSNIVCYDYKLFELNILKILNYVNNENKGRAHDTWVLNLHTYSLKCVCSCHITSAGIKCLVRFVILIRAEMINGIVDWQKISLHLFWSLFKQECPKISTSQNVVGCGCDNQM